MFIIWLLFFFSSREEGKINETETERIFQNAIIYNVSSSELDKIGKVLKNDFNLCIIRTEEDETMFSEYMKNIRKIYASIENYELSSGQMTFSIICKIETKGTPIPPYGSRKIYPPSYIQSDLYKRTDMTSFVHTDGLRYDFPLLILDKYEGESVFHDKIPLKEYFDDNNADVIVPVIKVKENCSLIDVCRFLKKLVNEYGIKHYAFWEEQ